MAVSFESFCHQYVYPSLAPDTTYQTLPIPATRLAQGEDSSNPWPANVHSSRNGESESKSKAILSRAARLVSRTKSPHSATTTHLEAGLSAGVSATPKALPHPLLSSKLSVECLGLVPSSLDLLGTAHHGERPQMGRVERRYCPP